VPLQFAAQASDHGDDAKPAAPGWTRLAGAGLQHGQPAAKDATGGHRRRADHDRLASAGGQHGQPVLPALLSQIPANERIASVSGDGAYDTKDCHEAIALRAAQAIIPTFKNAKPWKTNRCGADARNDILPATKRLGRAIWKRWSGYHRRSLVEAKMGCFKLLGERVMARDFDRQVAELQVRAAVLNRFTRLGTPITVPVL
jgi:hypothetical protein